MNLEKTNSVSTQQKSRKKFFQNLSLKNRVPTFSKDTHLCHLEAVVVTVAVRINLLTFFPKQKNTKIKIVCLQRMHNF